MHDPGPTPRGKKKNKGEKRKRTLGKIVHQTRSQAKGEKSKH